MKKDFSSFNINTTFISADKNVEQACAGDYYYNAVLEANTSVNLINTITPAIDSSLLGQTLRLKIQAEVVNYIGGPYYTWRDLPWKDYPPAWFVNQSYLTKAKGSTVTPHIPLSFHKISKIEMTAKTPDNTSYLPYFASPGLNTEDTFIYIETTGSSTAWFAGGRKSGSQNVFFDNFIASLTPAQARNGFNTIAFSWTGIRGIEDDEEKYVYLGYDVASMSPEIICKQIKIWDTDGKLAYDLRPDDRTGVNTGKFYNYLDGTVLDMYDTVRTDGITVATVTDSVYETHDNVSYPHCYYGASPIDGTFEQYSVGSGGFNLGAHNVRYRIEKDGENKVLKMWRVEPTINSWTNIAVFCCGNTTRKKYRISLKYKTNIPRERFYIKNYFEGGKYQANSIFLKTNDMIVIPAVSYSYSGDWELMTFTCTSVNMSSWICFVIPEIATGDYAVWIDDFFMREIP